MTTVTTQGSRSIVAAGVALAVWACGGHSTILAPTSPEAAVRSFLNAVHANSLSAMSELWGSSRGPARSYMNGHEMEQRLTIIQTYLQHERFEILESQSGPALGVDGRRSVKAQLLRRGCQPVVPFTLVPYGGGWLVSDIDLSAAGNPQRSCPPPGAGADPRGGEPGAGNTGSIQ